MLKIALKHVYFSMYIMCWLLLGTGDPIIDMEAQRKSNKIKIKYLINDNFRLKNTIGKLKTARSNILHE